MQLALDINLPENKSMDNFCWHGNELLQSQLELSQATAGERFFYLWGRSGSGKSHILQAITQRKHISAIYLPLEQLKDYGPDVFDGIEQLDVICLDNIEKISGIKELEVALFHLYNRLRDNGHSRLFIAGQHNLANLGIQLPDLHSRLSWGLVFHLKELDEEHKIEVLSQQAQAKGLELSTTVSQYLINHYARDMHQLSHLIDTLDKASLAAQRKLTIPFIKQILNNLNSI